MHSPSYFFALCVFLYPYVGILFLPPIPLSFYHTSAWPSHYLLLFLSGFVLVHTKLLNLE